MTAEEMRKIGEKAFACSMEELGDMLTKYQGVVVQLETIKKLRQRNGEMTPKQIERQRYEQRKKERRISQMQTPVLLEQEPVSPE